MDEKDVMIEKVQLQLEQIIERRARNGLWRTLDGKDIAIRDMDDAYLHETLIFFGVEHPEAAGAAALPWLLVERNRREME